MPKSERNPKLECRKRNPEWRTSGFGFRTSFVIRHSSLYSPHTLRHDLEKRGRLPIADCVQIGFSLTIAIAHLHQHGLVHRDIKPSNVIFVADFLTFSPAHLPLTCLHERSHQPEPA
jgi:hypothetical protein